MAKCDVGGVEGAQTAAVGNNCRMVILLVHEGKDFVEHVLLILNMASNPSGWMSPPTVKTFAVHAIEAIELDMALFDFGAKHIDHPEIFVFVESRSPRWKYQYLRSSMTEEAS